MCHRSGSLWVESVFFPFCIYEGDESIEKKKKVTVIGEINYLVNIFDENKYVFNS